MAALVKGYKGRTAVAQTGTFEATIPNIKKNTEYGKLSNGLQYALLKKPVKGDKIFANFILKVGDENSLSGKNSIPMLTARMLKSGTTTRSKKDINDQLDKIKSSISIGSGGGGATININLVTDKENAVAALDLLADILLHPSFDSNEFSKLLIDIGSELDESRSNPQSVALNTFRQKMSLYPKGHPLYPETVDDQAADLKAVSLADVRAFYGDFYGVDHGYVSFVGDIDGAAIKPFLDKGFAGFKSQKPYTEIETKYFDIKGAMQTIVIPDKKNATLYGGINIPLKESDADYAALDIANEMLGGGAFISSRVAKRLRENEGMSYGAGTFISPGYKYATSTWGVFAIFNPIYKNRLDSAFKDEVGKALQGGFTADELKTAVTAWLGTRKTLIGVDQYLVFHVASFLEEGKDMNFDTEYEDKVKSLSVDQVNAALKKYINPDKMMLIYAGDFK